MLKTTVRRSAKILSGLLLLSLLQACGEGEPTPANLALFAGDVVAAGSADGAGTAARFNAPLGIAADSAGNIYVADTLNHTIRKIDSTGGVVTLAGTAGSLGMVNNSGANARFNLPSGVTADSAGNVYVADTTNHSIRKIDSAGAVTTLAGTTAPGNTNGGGSIARFNFPSGIAIDSAGILYVVDTNNHTIRKIVISNTGVVTVSTLAGAALSAGSANGDGLTIARFNSPNSITIDSLGNLYVADTSNHTIRKIVISSGVATVSTLAGTALSTGSADGLSTAARFNTPLGITTDSAGNVYVADTNNHTVRKITPAGETSTVVGVAGSAGFTPGFLPGQLSSPTGVAISGTSLYVTTGNGVAVVARVP